MTLRVTAVFCVLATLVGCAPMYRTHYDFTLPRDRIGRLCAAQCGTTREICRSTAENRAMRSYNQCETEAQQEYYRCLNASTDPKQRSLCFLRQCYAHADNTPCDAHFRQCYGACGGQVTPRRQCVFNCPASGQSH